MPVDPPRRKRIRLDHAAYSVAGSTRHMTVDACDFQPHFTDPALAGSLVETLVDRCARARADLLLYCVMPQHVHALIAIGRDGLISIMRAVKSLTGRWWKAQGQEVDLWQRSFYDRSIRTDAQMNEAIRYVLKNPIDEGLVAVGIQVDWRELA